ncbi:MAG: hypothetical protein AWM53_00342 [Candidatus Dichloromethanomonas elyunquensis]|nr:MAG: hypothetical protein AWM53_00342 [Candidatus Dichloromethanomonas elyunquensis]
MDEIDRILLNNIQHAFPIDLFPYRILGSEAGIEENEAWQRVEGFRKRGIIRRLGGVFDSRRLGYTSTLCAAKVPHDKILTVADFLNGINEVTHNYLRSYEYNMWFTIIAVSQEKLTKILRDVQQILGNGEVFSLPAQRVYKINVQFNLEKRKTENLVKEKVDERFNRGIVAKNVVSDKIFVPAEEDKMLIRLIQDNLPHSISPFAEIAQKLSWSKENVFSGISRLLENQVLRRFGAVLKHQKVGFTSNAMGVWIVPEDKIDACGYRMAQFKEVSHCYKRQTFPGWPYNLFTMIHGHTEKECSEIAERISHDTGIKDYKMLFSLSELKKSSMRYFTEEN